MGHRSAVVSVALGKIIGLTAQENAGRLIVMWQLARVPQEVGAHIYNPAADGEWIAPFCTACNNDKSGVFTLEDGVTLVPANQVKTCAQ